MRRFGGLMVVIVAVVIVLLVVCVGFAPGWIVQDELGRSASAVSAVDRLKAINDVRGTLLQGLAALVALGGLAVGAVMTRRQILVHREGQFIDLFTKACEQLSSDQVAVRHGGVYAMEQIASTAPHYRGHVGALLASFVRQQAPWPTIRSLQEVDAERERYTGGLRDDVGGAMGVLGRRSMILPGTGIELEKADLRGAELAGLNLSRFCFAGSNLDGAILTGCDLSHATLDGASLKNADLKDADLTGTDLAGADLTGADMTGVIGVSAPSVRPEDREV
jgi:hypothetical protein